MGARKIIGIGLLVAGFIVLGLFFISGLSRQGPDPEPQPMVRVFETSPLDPYGPGALRTGDAPRISLPTAPGEGRLLHVSGEAGPDGDGSRERPWRSLAVAVCRLRPGDRLVVLSGRFDGPVRIGGDCVNGAPGKPVEVHFHEDVELHGSPEPGPRGRAVLELARSHWVVAGLQVLPAHTGVGIVVAPGVEGVRLDSIKINRGVGSGVRVGYGASDVELLRVHIHHMGLPEDDTAIEAGRPDTGDSPAAAVVIEPGTQSVRIRQSKFHNIRGEMVRVIEPQQFEAVPALPPADYSIDEETYLAGRQEPWW